MKQMSNNSSFSHDKFTQQFRELIERLRAEELERIKRYKKWLEDKANWVMSEKDAALLLEVTEEFLKTESEME